MMIGGKETPFAVHTSWYLLILLVYVGGGCGKLWYNSQEDEEEVVKWGYEILGRLGRWKYQGGEDVHFDEEHSLGNGSYKKSVVFVPLYTLCGKVQNCTEGLQVMYIVTKNICYILSPYYKK